MSTAIQFKIIRQRSEYGQVIKIGKLEISFGK